MKGGRASTQEATEWLSTQYFELIRTSIGWCRFKGGWEMEDRMLVMARQEMIANEGGRMSIPAFSVLSAVERFRQ